MRRIIKNLCDQRKTALLATEIRTQETEALSLLLHGLESAKNVQCKEAGLWCCDINLKQYSDGLLGLSKALEKIIDGKGTLDAAQNSVNKAASVIFRGAQEVYHTDAFLRISELAKQIGWNYDVDGQCEVEYLARSLCRWETAKDRQRVAKLLLLCGILAWQGPFFVVCFFGRKQYYKALGPF